MANKYDGRYHRKKKESITREVPFIDRIFFPKTAFYFYATLENEILADSNEKPRVEMFVSKQTTIDICYVHKTVLFITNLILVVSGKLTSVKSRLIFRDKRV